MTQYQELILRVFLGGPDAPRPDLDILSQIRDRAMRSFNGVRSTFKVVARRYREPPDIIHPEPSVNVQAEIDAELAAGLYDIALFLFRDRLGSPHPDGYKSYTVKELEQAIALRKENKGNAPRPHIVVYKAARSWQRADDRELGKLSPDARHELLDRDNKRQVEHVHLSAFLEELQKRPEYGSDFTIVIEENSDENIIDGAINVIEKFAARIEGAMVMSAVRAPQSPLREKGWPYPGIRDFALNDWNIFYGREEKIAEALAAIDSGKKIITINGGSGSGKTSLLQAGILGNMRHGSRKEQCGSWVYLDIEPHPGGQDLFEKLAVKFESVLKPHYGGADNARRLKGALDSIFMDPPRAAQFDFARARSEFQGRFVTRSLDSLTPTHASHLVISINQAEYLTAFDGPARSQFLRFVTSAAMCPGVLVLMTLRDDVFGRLRSDPIIEHQVSDIISSVWLSPPDPVELNRMIEEPAKLAGLEVEPRLLKRIRLDANERGGDSLPLVAQCLNAVCKRSVDSKLTLQDYEAFGGLSGVVASQVRELEDLISPDALLHFFDAMLGLGRGDRLERRAAPLRHLHKIGISEEFVVSGIENRLFQEVSENDIPSIRLQHDILLDAWPRLKAWIREQRPRFEQRRTLIDDAERWEKSGRKDGTIRLSESMTDLLRSKFFLADVEDKIRPTVEEYILAARQKVARQDLVFAVNAGLPGDIRKALAEGATLTETERGEGLGQLRPQFWAAVTGNDAVDEDLYLQRRQSTKRLSRSRRRSVFDDPKLVNSCVTRGISVLHLAALCGNTELLRRLVRDYDADPSQRSERGGTALSYAAYCGKRETCRFLIEDCGIKPNLLDEDGSSAALWAAQQGHSDLSAYLVGLGSPLDVTIAGGWNRMTEMTRSGDLIAVKAAISAGYSPHQPTELGLTPALIACSSLHPEILEYLIAEHDVDLTARDNDGRTAYDLVCFGSIDVESSQRRQRAERMIDLLIQKLPIDMIGFGGERPLIHAVSAGAVEVAEALIRNGAKLEAIPPTNTIPLFAAISDGQSLTTMLLLSSNANVNATNAQGVHALHIAAQHGDVDTMGVLLDRPNVRVNAQDSRGITPLLLASARGRHSTAALLMDHGALPFIPTIDGGDALSAALVVGHELVVKELLRARLLTLPLFERASEDASRGPASGASLGTLPTGWPSRGHLLLAATGGRPDLVEVLTRAGVDPNDVDAAGDTALHDAARLPVGSSVAVQMILPYMRDLGAKNAGGHTAADLALASGNDDVAKMLATVDAEPIWWTLPKVSEELPFLNFVSPTEDELVRANDWLDAFGFWCKVPREHRRLKLARLPFYETGDLLAIEDDERRGPREQFALLRGQREFVPMNWTNEPIYAANDRWTAIFTEETTSKYVRFFFRMVRGYLGSFRIVESIKDIIWAGEVTEETKQAVELRLRPLKIEDREFKAADRAVFGATVIFKNALFFTKILISLRQQTITDPDGAEQKMSTGQARLFDEELLLEDLPVYVGPPPSTWG